MRLAHLFDHLVGKHEYVMRNSKPERFGGLEIDDEIEFGRLLDRQVAGLRPAQNLSTNSAARRNRSGKLAPYDSRPPATTSSRRPCKSLKAGKKR